LDVPRAAAPTSTPTLSPAAGQLVPAGDPLGGAQPPTISDVARVAGVSIASVSRVLNGRRNPRPETRDRVLQAVADLGFVPDGAARAVSVRREGGGGGVLRRA